jgi:hypothetical protein
MLSLSKGIQLVRNMGIRYVGFRVMHEIQVRTGFFKKKFPQNPPFKTFISLEEWRRNAANFFFEDRSKVILNHAVSEQLSKEFKEIEGGLYTFFSSLKFDIGKNYDWVTNPDTKFKYPISTHWSQVNDFNKEAGDIKYVWEKSRFSFLYTIIRYDAKTGEDHSEWVWKEISSWIESNPINSGPNYKCSQEISLRVLNWTFALYFYRDARSLTEDVFQKILFNIFWQLHHVYNNINFSRIAVRNNHAITETLTLYLGGLLFPFFPDSYKWKTKGKKWFEEEVAYQIYADGTFLQFSMNYHRVVVQLLTWGIQLAELNKERFADVVYERATKSLDFLTSCMNSENGWLPNYGANDGALFFKLNDNHYRDYRPQLEALSYALSKDWVFEKSDDVKWYGFDNESKPVKSLENLQRGIYSFKKGGYYVYRNDKSLTLFRCGNHKDRPSQADNLHIDIWYKGLNVLHDAGSYKYNTEASDLKYFMGTQSHNTVMLDDYDQMEKGARFIWFDWTQCENMTVSESIDTILLDGTIKAFQYVSSSILHQRKLTIYKNKPVWEIEDIIHNKPDSMLMKQLWHTSYPEIINFAAELKGGEKLQPSIQQGYVSNFYGIKEICTEFIFSTKENTIKTQFKIYDENTLITPIFS